MLKMFSGGGKGGKETKEKGFGELKTSICAPLLTKAAKLTKTLFFGFELSGSLSRQASEYLCQNDEPQL